MQTLLDASQDARGHGDHAAEPPRPTGFGEGVNEGLPAARNQREEAGRGHLS